MRSGAADETAARNWHTGPMKSSRLLQHAWPFAVSAGLVALLGALQLFNSFGLAGPDIAWGVVPRSMDHLAGVLTFHFRHDGWGHYLANALPLLALPAIAGAMAPRATAHGWWIIPLGSGLFLWLIGRPAIHVGASALVYGWFFFLVGLAVFHRSWAGLLGLAVALGLFGGLFWVFAGGDSVSWEGHLGGALAGLAAARMTRPERRTGAPGPVLRS